MLNISRLESGILKIKNDWCDINEVIYEVIKKTKETKVTQRFDIQIPDSLPYFFIDHGLMEQVLLNLIHNAVTYSPADTTISICASCIIDQLVITVEDQGNGFPADQIDKVFGRFYRLNNSRTGGTGLGLSIVKGFVEAQNGTVSLNNKSGGGAIFTISIPAKTSFINNLKNE